MKWNSVILIGNIALINKWKMKGLKTIYDRYIHWRLPLFTHPEYPVILEYPIRPEPRYGDGKPAHPELAALLALNDEAYVDTLTMLSGFSEQLIQIPEAANPNSPGDPHWNNTYFSALDAIALYGILGSRAPSRYMEVGSGNSTKFARRAIRDLELKTKIISVDPYPRAEIDALCDRVIRQPLEDVDTGLFNELEAGDVLFVDNSHRVFQNSDVTVFFLDILPRLKPGVIVHIHDIFLPFDYPGLWADRHYSEQYLLAAYLLAGCSKLDILLPLAYIGHHPKISEFVNNTWSQPVFQLAFSNNCRYTGGYIGTSFWLTIK